MEMYQNTISTPHRLWQNAFNAELKKFFLVLLRLSSALF